MADTPNWLENSRNAAPAAVENEMTLDAPANTATTDTAGNGEDDKDLPSIILYMRLANMGVATALIVISVLLMISLPSLSAFVLAIYATCGGLLICCLETQLKFLRVMIAVNFGFLFNSVWRFVFYMIIASVAWSYETVTGRIVAGCWAGVALFNTFVLCRYPGYRKIRERIAEEEDKRIEARISKEVKRQAINQAMK